jgi:hypothetical protein
LDEWRTYTDIPLDPIEKSLSQIDELIPQCFDLPYNKTVAGFSDFVRHYLKNCFLIIDKAGSGKTNLLCHLADKYSTARPVVFVSGKAFLEDEFALVRYIEEWLST